MKSNEKTLCIQDLEYITIKMVQYISYYFNKNLNVYEHLKLPNQEKHYKKTLKAYIELQI